MGRRSPSFSDRDGNCGNLRHERRRLQPAPPDQQSGSDDTCPAWSPDGSQIAFDSDRDGNYEIYVMNADGSNPHNLSNNPANDEDPVWSPDGSQIAFDTKRGGNNEIYVMNADGSNQHNLSSNPADDRHPAWRP